MEFLKTACFLGPIMYLASLTYSHLLFYLINTRVCKDYDFHTIQAVAFYEILK